MNQNADQTSSNKSNKFRSGLSIPEAMVSMVVIAIGILGTVNLRYQAVLDARRAEVGMAASRLALTLIETWRGLQGDEAFDPVDLLDSDLNIDDGEGPAQPNGFTAIGSYIIVINNSNYYATLSYKDIDSSLRQLNVNVSWEQRGNQGMSEDDSDKSFGLTTYVQR